MGNSKEQPMEKCNCKMYTKEFENCPHINNSATSCSIYEAEQSEKRKLILREYLKSKAEKERDAGAEMFLGLPDRWYDNVRFACENGHISKRVLKSEALCRDACMQCNGATGICPPETTEDELKELFKP